MQQSFKAQTVTKADIFQSPMLGLDRKVKPQDFHKVDVIDLTKMGNVAIEGVATHQGIDALCLTIDGQHFFVKATLSGFKIHIGELKCRPVSWSANNETAELLSNYTVFQPVVLNGVTIAVRES